MFIVSIISDVVVRRIGIRRIWKKFDLANHIFAPEVVSLVFVSLSRTLDFSDQFSFPWEVREIGSALYNTLVSINSNTLRGPTADFSKRISENRVSFTFFLQVKCLQSYWTYQHIDACRRGEYHVWGHIESYVCIPYQGVPSDRNTR